MAGFSCYSRAVNGMVGTRLSDFEQALSLLESSNGSGQAFYEDAVRALSLAFGCRWAGVVRLAADGATGQALAVCDAGEAIAVGSYALAGTPCEAVYQDAAEAAGRYVCASGLEEAFPDGHAALGVPATAYSGWVIRDRDGAAVGHVFVMDEKPLTTDREAEFFLRLLAQRLAAEFALSHSESNFQALAEHVPAVVCLKDASGRYLYVNRRFCELYEIEAEAILGTTTGAFFDESFAGPILAQDRAVLAGGKAIEREHLVHGKSGDRSFLDVKFPVFAEGSEDAVAVGLVGSDVTEYQNTAAALHGSRGSPSRDLRAGTAWASTAARRRGDSCR